MPDARPTAWPALAVAAIVGISAGAGAVAAPLVPERVTFDSFDRNAAGVPVRLTALRYSPEGVAPARGAVIALHGCGGIYGSAKGREHRPTPRHQAMAEMLVGEGYVVLFPDSLNPRGRRELCTTKLNERNITVANRRLDALASLAWLQAQPGIAADRVALLGWSHGGSTTLAATNAKNAAVAAFLRPRDAPFFATAIAFYPGCAAYARRPERFAPAAPLRILIGESDDWTPAAPCAKLAEAMAARALPVVVKIYPDTYHDFDAPGARMRVRRDVPNGTNPGKGVTTGGNAAAREDAYAQVKAILRASIGDGPRSFLPGGN